MNTSKISVRYAKSLFEVGIEQKILNELKTDASSIYTAIATISEFKEFIESPITKPSDKKLFIDSLLSAKISDMMLRFLYLIITNKREVHLQAILRNFLEMCKKHEGITDVRVRVAQPLSQAHKDTIHNTISTTFNTQVELHETVDTSIVGGIILQIDDLQFDASIKSKIHSLKQQFL